MRRVLIDTDVILDVLLVRPEFNDAAKAIWTTNQQGDFEGFVSAITPVNVYYVARKQIGNEPALRAVANLVGSWRICSVTQEALDLALNLPISDFEDGVQLASAILQGVTSLVTRNISDYRGATLSILSPSDFLASLQRDKHS